jgi:hypothetical protein
VTLLVLTCGGGDQMADTLRGPRPYAGGVDADGATGEHIRA